VAELWQCAVHPRPHFIIGHYEFYFALTLPGLRDYLVSVGGWSGAINLRLFNYIAFLLISC